MGYPLWVMGYGLWVIVMIYSFGKGWNMVHGLWVMYRIRKTYSYISKYYDKPIQSELIFSLQYILIYIYIFKYVCIHKYILNKIIKIMFYGSKFNDRKM